MIDLQERRQKAQRALLIGLLEDGQDADMAQESLAELAQLTTTHGAEVGDLVVVAVNRPNPRYLVGSGSAERLAEQCREQHLDLIIFDDDLSPAQQRNWEDLAKVPVVDRRGLILEIFAARASTREAELQIELARAEYFLPRLKRAWTHLGRQRGGAAHRGGEGEKQIELDARMLRQRIAKLRRELLQVRQRRAEQRKKRRSVPVPNAAIVGYTNAGKSSLLNLLTDADVLVEDKLFATLDPTTRRIVLPNNQKILLTDTVGFVRKLPHDLVDAFKATLEEAVLAEFLVHVVDASSPAALHQLQTTEEVLNEIGAHDKRTLIVFNKIDRVEDPFVLRRLRHECPEAVFVSARTGKGIGDMLDRLAEFMDASLQEMDLRIPVSRYELVAWLHRHSNVLSERYEDDQVYVTASVPNQKAHALAPYLLSQS